MANYNLTGQKIKNTYGQLAQVSGSTLVDGLGNETQIATGSIVSFDTEVSRSAAAAGFGGGGTIDTSSLVQNTTFNAYTSSNDSKVDSLTAATSSYLTSLPSGIVSGAAQLPEIGQNTTDIASLTAQTSSYLTSLPSGVVSGSSQVDLSLATGTAANATSASYAVTASHALNAGAAFPFTGSAGIQGNLDMNSGGKLTITDWTGSLNATSILIGQTFNDVSRVNTAGDRNVQIGYYSRIVESSTRNNCVVIGADAEVAQNSVSIGQGAVALVDSGLALGYQSKVYGNSGIAIGANLNGTVNNGILIGNGVTDHKINIGGAFILGLQGTDVSSIESQYFALTTPLITNQGVNGYADDTAAKAAGLPVGGIYHTSGSLKIVVA